MKRCFTLIAFLAFAGTASPSLRGDLLADFSCARPWPMDEGSWKNAVLAAGAIHGTVLAPGGEFSFLRRMAPVRDAFFQGKSLLDGKVVDSQGGGICQVSTALYNAVLLAGLPVLSRSNHSFYDERAAYVAPGRDAAVSVNGGKDLCFRNDSPVALTISAAAVDGRIAIQIWGRSRTERRQLITHAVRLPRSRTVARRKAPAPGFDGWKVQRALEVADGLGSTRVVSLDPDVYRMIPERVVKR